MAKMYVTNLATLRALGLDRCGDRAVRGTPRDDQQITVRVARRLGVGNVLRYGRNFGGADAHHVFVVEWFVVDISGDVLLLEAANAVFQPRRAGNSPRPRKRLWIALVGQVAIRGVSLFREVHRNRWNGSRVGNDPRLRAA